MPPYVSKEAEGASRPGLVDFLKVPRVKFVLKLLSYAIFLVVYVAALLQHGGYPEASFSLIDAIFFLWAVSLFVDGDELLTAHIAFNG